MQTSSTALRVTTAQCKMEQKHIQHSYHPQVQMDYNRQHMHSRLRKMDTTISPIISYCVGNRLPLYF